VRSTPFSFLTSHFSFFVGNGRRHPIRVHCFRRVNVESVGQAREEIKECAIVDRFRNLGIAPTHITQALNLLIADAIGVAGEGAYKFQQ